MATDYLQTYLVPLAQKNYLQRSFGEALVPQIMYLSLAPSEQMPPGSGGTVTNTVPGVQDVDLNPNVPGEDSSTASNTYEWYIARIKQHSKSRVVPMNQAALTIEGAPGYWMEIMKEQAIACGTTLNLLARNALFKAYLAGNTVTYAANGNTTSVHLVSGNGFRTTIVDGEEQPISVNNTRNVEIAGTARVASGWTPLDAANPDGAGVLTITVALNVLANQPVKAEDRSRIIRPNNGGLDSLVASDGATMALFRRAATELENDGVPTMPDGKYHCHVPPAVCNELRSDNEFQRMYETRGSDYMADGSLGVVGNLRFFSNNQSPQPGRNNSPDTILTSGLPASGRTTTFAPYWFGELTNQKGTVINRSIVVGKAAIKTMYVDESANMLAEGGAPTGPRSSFAVVGSTLQMMSGSNNMGNVRVTIRPPIDKLGQVSDVTWSTTRGYAVTSNLLSGQSNARNKRALVIETGFAPLD